jgi:hypothetical protein
MIKKYALPLTLTITSNDHIITGTVVLNGTFKGASITVPALSYTGGTVTATITNEEGGTVWTKASIAESTTTSIFADANNQYFRQPLSGTQTLKIETSTGQSANRNFVFYVYYE